MTKYINIISKEPKKMFKTLRLITLVLLTNIVIGELGKQSVVADNINFSPNGNGKRENGKLYAQPMLLKGFNNPGNCCFMISVIQLLFNNRYLNQYILAAKCTGSNKITMTLKSVFKKKMCNDKNINNELLIFYNEVFNKGVYNPTHYKLASLIPQQDSDEFLHKMYDAICNEYIDGPNAHTSSADREKFAERCGFGVTVKTVESKKASGYPDSKYSVVKTTEIIEKGISTLYTPNSSLQQCLDEYFYPACNTYSQSDDNMEVDRKAQYIIDNMPNRLTINIGYGNTNDSVLPQEFVIINECKYMVSNIIIRSTEYAEQINSQQGHYYTISRCKDRWYLLSDDNVKEYKTLDDVYTELFRLGMLSYGRLPSQQIRTVTLTRVA